MIDQASYDEVRQLLKEEGFTEDKISIADAYYAIPTEDTIREFGKRFGSFLWASGLDTWIEEIWDCDNFAITANALANIDNALWRKRTGADCGLGFGIVWVKTEQGGHAINCALARNKETGKLELHYYEPQLQAGSKFGEPSAWLQRKSRDYFVSPLWCYL
jgi:hypothetical protein